MIALVCGATATMRRLAASGVLGQLYTPRRLRGEADKVLGLPWACDNDAFSSFDEARFRQMLEAHQQYDGCRWVTAPDVVADAAATLRLFEVWEPRLREYGVPVALVAQDGLACTDVPWEHVDALFIGGSTEFKLGPAARDLIAAAREQGKLTHAGRVNWWVRIRYFRELGVDSFDGSSLSRWPEVWLPHVINLLQNEQLTLEESA